MKPQKNRPESEKFGKVIIEFPPRLKFLGLHLIMRISKELGLNAMGIGFWIVGLD